MAEYIPMSGEDPMRTLCRMVVGTTYEDLPANVIDQAKRSALDTLAVTIGGSAMEGIPAIVDLVKDKGGKPESIIPFYGGRVPASEAGLAIGPMSRAMDMGDVHDVAGHCSEYIFPALLAATGLKSRVSGQELITAFVLGREVLIRIGTAYRRDASSAGWSNGQFIFGCVAAVGKLLGLSLNELEEAEGIACEMTQPQTRLMYSPPTLMICVHHGFICQDAINACLLARKGITGPLHGVLSAPIGYLEIARWEADPGGLTRGLGEKWEMTGVMMKRYTSPAPMQAALDAILELLKEHSFKADDIAQIEVNTISLPGTPEARQVMWHPQTVSECQFSLPYNVATAAYDGDVFLESYTPQARARQNVRDLMARISVKDDADLPSRAARVHATLKDGRRYSKECLHPKGHPQNPFTTPELVAKFRKCVRYSAFALSRATVEAVIDTVLHLEKVDDAVGALLVPLTPG